MGRLTGSSSENGTRPRPPRKGEDDAREQPERVAGGAPREGTALALAVNGRRRAEDELTDAARARKLKQVERAADVRLGVEHRLGERRAHARARGEVDDAVEGVRVEDGFERGAVADVGLVEAEGFAREGGRDGAALERRVVEVVEVVNHVDAPAPPAEQPLDEVRADEARAARD